ncbi:MAG TPA: M6 family metalloprotease domain-containing protein [Candidatus Cloacimonadota bacterium]|nr:M6 family metalloprotease domain-containing protein [Candidatus Cloacimonadota bacterium]
MRRITSLAFLIMVLIGTNLVAAPHSFLPIEAIQPDGSKISIFASGDEFHNWLHDENNYTIVRDSRGAYVYAVQERSGLAPSNLLVGRDSPSTRNITPGLNLSQEEIKAKYDRLETMRDYSNGRAPHSGQLNNIVIFIRFSDSPNFSTSFSYYQQIFNSTTDSSMRRYFRAASYNQLTVDSFFYPAPSGTTVVCYTDTRPRSFFQPYSSSNTNGYSGDTERRDREHQLLQRAVNGVSAQIPTSLNIDGDNDGYVDNVCFIVQGAPDGWAELLWPHRWVLYSVTANINGKRVWDFNFQLETSLNNSGASVLSHEMFHSLGAPDLYRYSNTSITPVGRWDLMATNLTPPQHMSAWMKHRYGQWISSVPTITSSGSYTLYPVASSSTSNIYRINSWKSNEYYVLEYRKSDGTYDGNLPGTGLLVYRLNPSYEGNAQGPPDELYIYRPGGTNSVNGTINQAFFSQESGRKEISEATTPNGFLGDGSAGGLNIYDIGSAGNSITFKVKISDIQLTYPHGGETWQSGDSRVITWKSKSSSGSVKLEYSSNGGQSWTQIATNLSNTGSYTWSNVPSMNNSSNVHVRVSLVGTSHSDSNYYPFTVGGGTQPGEHIIGNGTSSTGTSTPSPINVYYKSLHGQMVYTKAELNAAGVVGPVNITKIGFNITGLPGYAMPNFVIRMGHTSATNASSWISSGLTQVWRSSSYQPTATGWNMYTLATPFLWNGTDNIVVDTAFGLTSSWSSTGTIQYTSLTNGYRYVRNDSADQTSVFSGGSTSSYRPNLKLVIQVSGGGGDLVVGNGTSSTGTSEGCPINLWYKSLHGQAVYTKAELNAAGVVGPVNITQIGLNITGLPNQAMPNFVIRMAHTSATNASSWISSGLTQVWRSSSYQPTATGWNMYTLSTPFLWNGTDNIVVDTAFGLISSYSQTGTVQYTSVTSGYRFVRSDSADQTSVYSGGYTSSSRPNLKLAIQASGGGGEFVIGTGTSSTGTTTPSPINVYWKSLHGQAIYTKAELNAAGVYGPISITKIGFNITGLPANAMPNFVVRMGHTSATNVSSWVSTGLTQVWRNSSYRPTVTGWNLFVLSTPFLWNGRDNIVVDTAFGLMSSYSSSGTVQYTNMTSGYRFVRSDSADQTSVFSGGYTSTYRPNIKLVLTSAKGSPLIVVDPSSLSYDRVVSGNTEVKTFIIQNMGDESLTFNIGVDQLASRADNSLQTANDLEKSSSLNSAAKADVSASEGSLVLTESLGSSNWLRVEPQFGSIAAGESVTITAYSSAVGMTAGNYQALLTIQSNDPESPSLNVNASMDVISGEVVKLDTPVISGLTKIDGGICITWKAVESADFYEVWRSTDPNGNFKMIASDIKDLQFDDLTELPMAFYYIRAIKK